MKSPRTDATYSERLRHPNWQRKRLLILERARFTCEECGDTTKTLHVHHTYYEKGLNPWDYPDHSLRSLCVDCHAVAQDKMAELHRVIGCLGSANLDRVIGYAIALACHSEEHTAGDVSSYERAEGFGHLFGKTADEVIATIKSRSSGDR